MKLIKKLSSMIEDEIEGARCYAKMALEYKDSDPEMARIMYQHSLAEMQHMTDLHEIVVSKIDEYRRSKGEPPAAMLAVYEYVHDRHIDEAAEVKAMQNLYANRS